ncbi:MAG: efflux RND transporter periplasmic adaptor subunit [Thermoanaerobaculaceae bacterium]
MARKRIWLIVVVAVAVVGATVALATRRGNGEGNKKDDFPIAKVEAADVQVEVLEVGTVEPGIKVDVKSALSGKLVELPVREGDVVRKGQLLAAVEPDVNQAQTLATVRRSVNQAEIEFVAAQKDFKGKEELLRAGLLSIEAHRDAETRYRTAQEALEAAREKSQIVQSSGVPITANASQVANITAPMDGVVIRRPVELGEAVTGAGSFNAGTVIVTIADLSTMLVKAGVNEVDIGKVRLGAPVTVSLDAYPKVRFAGKVARIAPAARLAEQVKVFDVEIALDSQGKELRTGMTANISIKGERAEGVLAVPVEAVFRRDDGDVVYVRKAATPESAGGKKPEPKATPDPREAWKQRFDERKVETGLASLAKVQVVAGLTSGEEVALEDPTKLKKKES